MNALNAPPVKGFHINTLTTSVDIVDNLGFASPMAEAPNSRRVYNSFRPASHPYHAAGLYYMQEPSAMLPVAALDFSPYSQPKVLDMCAAPGGKSSQLAIKTNGEGLLVSNEFDRSRAEILRENIVRMGYKNTLILSMHPEILAAKFQGYFDIVVVDAPCSGEGMLRKEPQALLDWSEANIRACAARQKEIINSADACLKEGGTLLYSTCTFAPEEDELMAEYILSLGYELLHIPEIITAHAKKVTHGVKFMPHLFEGEGQYFCLFRKTAPAQSVHFSKKAAYSKASAKVINAVSQVVDTDGLFIAEKNGMIFAPAFNFDLPCLMNGVLLGKLERDGRFTPSHQLFSALGSRCHSKLNLSVGDSRLNDYLSGKEINVGEIDAKGWTAVTVDGFPLGGGKISGDVLKNHYPKSLRYIK